MTIIVFLVDTSASMNQRTYLGTTLFDIAKGAVETFMKFRSRDPASRWDRYMLLTFEDTPANIKAGWKESHATFMQELKNLQAHGLTNLGSALKHTFDLLNVNRMQSGIDTYGQGRCPFYMEPAVIICLTDGRKLTTPSGVHSELNLPMNYTVPGSELTKEPFRWDQRLFGMVLRLPAQQPTENMSSFIPSADDSPIDAMCEVTGGRSYSVRSQRMMLQCLESLVQKVQPGVVINFEKTGADPPPLNGEIKQNDEKDTNGAKENQDVNKLDAPLNSMLEDKKRATTPTPSNWHNCRKLIYVPRSAQKGYSVGHWPIPEAFWPDLNSPTLTPRGAHPIVKFSCSPCEPMVVENLPFDKYELEPSPLTQYILERRQPSVCWQVFVNNSAKYSDIGHPFGYLKASTNLTSVNLFVMPYNYPVLLPLLDELFKVYKMKPTQKWRQQFDNYLKAMPIYYAGPLRRALARIGQPNLVPDNLDNCLSYAVISYLKKLKNQAKMEMDRLVASVGQKPQTVEGIKVTSKTQISLLQRKDFPQLLQWMGGDMSQMSTLKQQLQEFETFTLAVPDPHIHPQSYRNPFDIQRKNLLDQIARMRANFLQTSVSGTRLQDEDNLHSIPVQQMGNYQEYLKKSTQPLREIETQPMRLHMFGNPFKVNKDLMIDEADEAMPGQQKQKRSAETPPGSPGPRKRKPGPLPKDIPIRRPVTPPVTTRPQQPEAMVVVTPQPRLADLPPEIENRPPDGNVSPGPSLNNIPTAMEEEGEDEEKEEAQTVVTNHMNFQGSQNHIEDELTGPSPSPSPPTSPVPTLPLENGDVLRPGGKNNNYKKETVQLHNGNLKKMVYKEVKRPGKNYDKLFQHLNSLQGNLDTRCLFIRDIVREAGRFKKKVLIGLLEQFEQSMVKLELRKQRTSSTNQNPPSR